MWMAGVPQTVIAEELGLAGSVVWKAINQPHYESATQCARRPKGMHRRGEANQFAKLSDEKAREVLQKRAAGAKVKDLAAEYHVTHSAISLLICGKTYKHLERGFADGSRRYMPMRRPTGVVLHCKVYGPSVVRGTTDAEVAWPYTYAGSKRRLIVCGSLLRAVRNESVETVCRLWGVSRKTVWRWRNALGVDRVNPGTREVLAALSPRSSTDRNRSNPQPEKPMPIDSRRRINLSLTPGLAKSLRILGLSPDLEPDAGVPVPGAIQITGAVARYADAVARAGRELEKLLRREEWNFLAECLNGCADIWEWSETPIGSMHLILAEAEDSQRLNGTGDKCFADEIKPGSGQKKTDELLAKLRGLTQIHGDAIMSAIRYFWSHCQDVDRAEHKWWTVDYRMKAKVETK